MPHDPFLETLDGYDVDRVPAVRAHKVYRCPGCGNEIPAGTGHAVAWPDGRPDERRHWHLHCWRLAARRGSIA